MLDVAPGTFGADQFGAVEPDLGFGQGVVVGVADAADRRVDTGLDEPVGEGEGGVSRLKRDRNAWATGRSPRRP